MKKSKASVDHVKLPQVLNSLVSGVAAVVSLYLLLALVNTSNVLASDIKIPPKIWALVFLLFAVGDAVNAKRKRPKRRKRRIPK